MKHLVLPLLLLMTSCASIVRNRDHVLMVVSARPVEIYRGDDPRPVNFDTHDSLTRTIKGQRHLRKAFDRQEQYHTARGRSVSYIPLTRSGRHLEFTAVDEETTRQFTIRPAIEPVFWGNVLFSFIGAPVDLATGTAYTYRPVLLDMRTDASSFGGEAAPTGRKQWYDEYTRRGRWMITAGIPYVNAFLSEVENRNTARSSTGFCGVSLGAEYHYSNRWSIAAEIAAIMDYKIPFPATLRREGAWENQNRINFSLTHNRNLRRFSLGYGLNFSRNRWGYHNWWKEIFQVGPEDQRTIYETWWSAGLRADAWWRMGPGAKMGLVYRPSFYRFDMPEPWKYEHSLSLDFKFYINPGKRIRPAQPRPERVPARRKP